MPAIVVPPGEQTWSFSCPGCSPVLRIRSAAPRNIVAAIRVEVVRVSPAKTPPSESASVIKKA